MGSVPCFLAPLTISVHHGRPWIARTHNSTQVIGGKVSKQPHLVQMMVQGNSASRGSGQATKPLVPILMGSASDLPFCEKIAAQLTRLGVAHELRIASAHKVPERLLELLKGYEADPRPKVYIAVAGRSNALSGVLDCAVSSPVISCPPYSSTFGGADLFSSIRMPGGVCPSLVLEPEAAALFAAKILGVYDSSLKEKVSELQRANRGRLVVDDAQLVSKTYESKIREALQAGKVTNEVASQGMNVRRGKVRDQFDGSGGELILVTTDRQSGFDRSLANVPFKGAVLNLTSAWWFKQTSSIADNHVLEVPHPNVTVARKCKPIMIEWVMRGYITGSTETSLWKNYAAGVRDYCGLDLPEGLVKNQKLDAPVLTPTTKDANHDRPISPKNIVKEGIMSQELYDRCSNIVRKLFAFGQKVAEERGLILVDTKYELGVDEEGIVRVIDEMHTPDSSRYWIKHSYAQRMTEGKEPENVDKEFLRLWFVDHCDPYDTSKTLPTPPDDLVVELGRKYIMLYEMITGESFDFIEGGMWGEEAIAHVLNKYAGSKVGSSV
eukprot:Plantae.Rhodophyta-Hildenbrandia_rubra.ctg3728.p1 GENE.Plantae.Rhodophyta-Hildenbrandia_rubra.ctg3728~~Plantae.Rhodophyta-Hildenbrandia_rubra.ctg3728.p1  ORF type:complete len:552 (-),score=92.01 Plantae.Rhodophyta-Hildenbrandia_rubra.ctg3728:1369-3024(-)